MANDEDARFYLVLDELHLLRGSTGTEIAGSLRVLIERLGLADASTRHKLRILASSASLPIAEAEQRRSSLDFLKSMYGSHGTWSNEGPPVDLDAAWSAAIVEGTKETAPSSRALGRPSVYEDIASLLTTEVADAEKRLDIAVREIAPDVVDQDRTEAVLRAGGALASACKDGPCTLSEIADRLFGSSACTEAVRGLMVLRSMPEWCTSHERPWITPFSLTEQARLAGAPSFRIHQFVRNLDGLYSALEPNGDRVTFSRPDFEKGVAFDGETGRRRFELLYCECCGEAFVGGRRGGSVLEGRRTWLLPSAQDLESLPEKSSADRFEDGSYDDYALFWPKAGGAGEGDEHFSWRPAWLDATSGCCSVGIPFENDEVAVAGHILCRTTGQDAHGRSSTARETSVPYSCPACGTDYRPRRRDGSTNMQSRLSPIRSFRTGFGKTAQVLTSELVAALKAQGGDGTLVAFSDSRRDAADLAIGLETGHHQDVRRELLLDEALRSNEPVPSEEEVERAKKEYRDADDSEQPDEIVDKLKAVFRRKRDARRQVEHGRSVHLPQLLELRTGEAYGDVLRPVTERLIGLGIHPLRGPGNAKLGTNGDGRRWHSHFRMADGQVRWKEAGEQIKSRGKAKEQVINDHSVAATDLLFSRSYFAMEETGLGYPSLLGIQVYDDEDRKRDAWLRIMADSYRVKPDPYNGDVHVGTDWHSADDAYSSSTRLRTLMARLDARFGAGDELSRFLDWLSRKNMPGGWIRVEQLYIRPVSEEDPAYRCNTCSRVHLHFGFSYCTRCGDPLPTTPTETAGEVRRSNHLGLRASESLIGARDKRIQAAIGES